MRVGFAIGNGPSRDGFDLRSLQGYGVIVGCNHLHREFTPDVLVSLDSRPSEEIARLDRSFNWLHLRGLDLYLDDNPVMDFRDLTSFPGVNSGMVACAYLAKVACCDVVYMIGFDFSYGKPTPCELPIENWQKLIDENSKTEFVRFGRPISAAPMRQIGDREWE